MKAFHGFQFNASYTFSKSLDYTSQNGQGIVIQNSLNPAGDKGLSDYDARNRFVMNFIYDLPFKGNRLVDGWQIGSIISDQSGNPVNLQANATGIGGLTGVGNAAAGFNWSNSDRKHPSIQREHSIFCELGL